MLLGNEDDDGGGGDGEAMYFLNPHMSLSFGFTSSPFKGSLSIARG